MTKGATFRSFNMFEPWTWVASLGFFAFLRTLIPREYTDNLLRSFRLWLQSFTPYIFCDVNEFDASTVNTLYRDVEVYLSSITAEAALRLSLTKPKNAKSMTFTMGTDQRTADKFNDVKVEWIYNVRDRHRPMYTHAYDSYQSDEKRSFTLQIGRRDKDRILEKYIAHIQARAKELKRAARDLLLYTNSKGRDSYYSRNRPWESVNFVHPASFDTLALDGDLKTRICDDLDKFASNEAYYQRVGKAWKRGYLLYGPPGTGKSSMIAAIANKMRYDVYDLELTEVKSNIELRKLLLHTSNRSVIVIEDIDCSLDLSGQRKKKKKRATPDPATPDPASKEEGKVTLSGLLNFVDGLWSCCGSERIFIFTTNYVEKLDPALLRAGRMDMHIHLSYCTFSAFQVLAKNYLHIKDHHLFGQLRTAFEGTYMTPAEVGEILIKNLDYPTAALEQVLVALDEHRVKPPPPPPDSDDEQEDEKGKDAAAKSKDGDGVVKSPEVQKADEDSQPAATAETAKSAKNLEKEMSLVEKIHPIDDAVEIQDDDEMKEKKKSSAAGDAKSGTEKGDAAVPPTIHANGGGLQDSAVTGDTSITFSNGGLYSSSAGKKKQKDVVADSPHSNGVAMTSSNDKRGDVADDSSAKCVKENGVVANSGNTV
ncbi:hypothetical protein Mapa_011357 [Marchantia paleacea]|nr:hypothetical protein Mapa_011357 [Marchantia paleacea]